MAVDANSAKEIIAKRIAMELRDGQLVNLGIGLPTMVANYIPEGVSVVLQSENGMVGMGPTPEAGKENKYITNAGGQLVSIQPIGAFFDTAMSFSLIRGGHVDVTVLGALEVDQEGNLSNWIIPGRLVPGMGGAMDLVTGAKRVIVAMQHTAKGELKIKKRCELPLTAKGQVNMIVSELGVMEVTSEGLVLKEIHRDTTVEEVIRLTDAELIIDENIKLMDI